MKLKLWLFATFFLATAPIVRANEPGFDAAVRDALLRNPEILLEVFALLEEREQAAAGDQNKGLIVGLAPDLFESAGPSLGNPEAKYVLVEFIDYRCGYCKANHAVLEGAVAGNPDMRIAIRQLPILGAESQLMAETALAVFRSQGQAAFEAAHVAFLDYGGPVTEQALDEVLVGLGIDAAQMAAARRNNTAISEQIAADFALARRLNIKGTPSFVSRTGIRRGFLNAKSLPGFVDGAGE